MPTFGIEVTRDDRWWMITVADLAGHVSTDGAVNPDIALLDDPDRR